MKQNAHHAAAVGAGEAYPKGLAKKPGGLSEMATLNEGSVDQGGGP
jgi:hypothetical protein